MSVAKKEESGKIIQPKKMGLLVENPVYKPFRYPWCYDAWLTQQRIHWLPEEVPLGDDVRDWQKNLSEPEKNLVTQIFRFFTQADVEVNNCYLRHYTTVFKPTEVLMMMTAFAAMETVHVAAYSHLLDTIGMPESEYSAFMKYKEMKDKYDYMQGFNVRNKYLKKLLEKYGKDNDEVWSSITTNQGSVSHLEFLTKEEKDVFKTAFELDQRWLVDLSADRTPHISQAQSINLFLPADVHKKDLHQIHYQAWKKGLKSLYYCRSKSIQRAENVNDANSTDITANVYKSKNQQQSEENKYEECLSCQ